MVAKAFDGCLGSVWAPGRRDRGGAMRDIQGLSPLPAPVSAPNTADGPSHQRPCLAASSLKATMAEREHMSRVFCLPGSRCAMLMSGMTTGSAIARVRVLPPILYWGGPAFRRAKSCPTLYPLNFQLPPTLCFCLLQPITTHSPTRDCKLKRKKESTTASLSAILTALIYILPIPSSPSSHAFRISQLFNSTCTHLL